MSTALDALLSIQATLLIDGSKGGEAGVTPATALGGLRGDKAVVYGEPYLSLLYLFFQSCLRETFSSTAVLQNAVGIPAV